MAWNALILRNPDLIFADALAKEAAVAGYIEGSPPVEEESLRGGIFEHIPSEHTRGVQTQTNYQNTEEQRSKRENGILFARSSGSMALLVKFGFASVGPPRLLLERSRTLWCIVQEAPPGQLPSSAGCQLYLQSALSEIPTATDVLKEGAVEGEDQPREHQGPPGV